ncbi:hypothetical protein NKH10_26670 [Mesorhizobium sp. M1340]|uniref:hypothetical protein n=1 Tax=Mesorhizobium sp. M1340 TaxID=2957087 RepID=UPI00333575ED
MNKRKQTPEDRAPFTRDEIISETRRAALALASMISNFGPSGQGPALAAQYLGAELQAGYDFDNVSEEDLNLIPIERHFLYHVVMDAFDYAYQVGSRGLDYKAMADERAHEVDGILNGFPRTDFSGEPSPLDTLNPQKFRQVLDTFMARYSLDGGSDLSIRDLALLANMGEAAVRTSLSAEGIKTVARGKGQSGAVPHSDAVSWLMGRRGFVPSAMFGGDDDMASTMHSIFTATNLDFRGALQKALEVAGLDVDGLADKASVPKPWLRQMATTDGVAKVDLPAIERIANALEAPLPIFAGKAVENLLARKFLI